MKSIQARPRTNEEPPEVQGVSRDSVHTGGFELGLFPRQTHRQGLAQRDKPKDHQNEADHGQKIPDHVGRNAVIQHRHAKVLDTKE